MKDTLKKLLKQNQGNITSEVIKEALDYHSPKEFFEDLLQYGCQSWIVSSLWSGYTNSYKEYLNILC